MSFRYPAFKRAQIYNRFAICPGYLTRLANVLSILYIVSASTLALSDVKYSDEVKCGVINSLL
jgi:hypothetical protein